MKNPIMKSARKHTPKRSLFKDEAGNIAIISAILFPIIISGAFTVYDITQQSGAVKYVRETATKACNRVVGSSLIKYPSSEERDATATAVIDTAFARNGKLENPKFTLEKGKNTAKISISADRKSVLTGTPIAGTVGTFVFAKAECAGLPPYPRINEVVYDANFAEAVPGEGTSNWYTRGKPWGITDPKDIGWEFSNDLSGNSTEHCGLEVQDWSRIWNVLDRSAEDRRMTLPPDSTNPFVVELDGWCNTGIQKTFELHPGEYELSIWYRGRFVRPNSTNQIGMYLQKSNPETLEPETPLSEDDKIITMNDPIVDWWKKYDHSIKVSEYAIYRVTVLGEGRNDSQGGLFTSFKLTYRNLEQETHTVETSEGD